MLAEEAGISRGLLYHYFGNKQAFREAVVRRAADDLIAQTAPPADGEPLERLLASVAAYVDYVVANYEGYVSMVAGAAGGNETLRADLRGGPVGADRPDLPEDAQGDIIPDTPATRLMVRGWSAMVEELVLTWVADPPRRAGPRGHAGRCAACAHRVVSTGRLTLRGGSSRRLARRGTASSSGRWRRRAASAGTGSVTETVVSPGAAVERDRAAVGGDDRLDQREPEAGAAVGRGCGRRRRGRTARRRAATRSGGKPGPVVVHGEAVRRARSR